MNNPIARRMPRGALFLAFNLSIAVFLALFVLVPVLTHFASRSEEISENAALLARFQNIARNARSMMKTTSQAGDPFLPGNEERLVSADLQASLKAIATTAGVRFLSIRGLQGGQFQQLHLITVSMEMEGPLPATRNVIAAIEKQMPFLFVTAASLRSVADGDEGLIRAELKVQGAMRDSGSRSGAAEAISE